MKMIWILFWMLVGVNNLLPFTSGVTVEKFSSFREKKGGLLSQGNGIMTTVINGVPINTRLFYASVKFAGEDRFCGATMLSPTWVVTAAHCVANTPIERIFIEFDSIEILRKKSQKQLRGVESVAMHPKFEASSEPKNDIALIELKCYIPRQNPKRFLPLCKQPLNVLKPGRQFLGFYGAGSTSRIKLVLPEKPLQAFFYETAFASINSSSGAIEFCRDDNICVEDISVNKNANICHFDDGSPLFTFEKQSSGPKCLYGVASYFRNSSDSNSTGAEDCNNGSFFTNVVHFQNWVMSVMLESTTAAQKISPKKDAQSPDKVATSGNQKQQQQSKKVNKKKQTKANKKQQVSPEKEEKGGR